MCDNPGVMARNFTTTEKFFGLPQGLSNKVGTYVSVLLDRDGILEIAEGICVDANKDYLVMLPNGEKINASFSYVRNGRAIPATPAKNIAREVIDAITDGYRKTYVKKCSISPNGFDIPSSFFDSVTQTSKVLAAIFPDEFSGSMFSKKIYH